MPTFCFDDLWRSSFWRRIACHFQTSNRQLSTCVFGTAYRSYSWRFHTQYYIEQFLKWFCMIGFDDWQAFQAPQKKQMSAFKDNCRQRSGHAMSPAKPPSCDLSRSGGRRRRMRGSVHSTPGPIPSTASCSSRSTSWTARMARRWSPRSSPRVCSRR